MSDEVTMVTPYLSYGKKTLSFMPKTVSPYTMKFSSVRNHISADLFVLPLYIRLITINERPNLTYKHARLTFKTWSKGVLKTNIASIFEKKEGT